MRPTITVILFGLLVALGVESGGACSCTEYPTFSRAVIESDAVFSGTVSHIEVIDGEFLKQVTLVLHDCWKGELADTLLVATELSEAACGYPFELDEDYLVYAMDSAHADGLWTHLCWRTHELRYSDSDIEALGSPNCSVAVDAKTWANVKRLYRSDTVQR